MDSDKLLRAINRFLHVSGQAVKAEDVLCTVKKEELIALVAYLIGAAQMELSEMEEVEKKNMGP